MQKHSFKGLVQVYTGTGKGKTTAALGLAVRALGREMPVFIVQFMKTPDSGEFIFLSKLRYVNIYAFGRAGFVDKNAPKDEDFLLASKAIEKSHSILKKESYGVLILDEINNAVDTKLISVEAVVNLIRLKPEGIELVLTGRNAHKTITDMADLVTNMTDIKHPWENNIPARIGIEW